MVWEGRERRKGRSRLGRRKGQRLQVKDKLRKAKEIRVVSAHICYWLEQRANTTRTRGKDQADRGRGTGAVVNLGGRDRIWARVELSPVRIGELSRLNKMVSGWLSTSIWNRGVGGCKHALLAACQQGIWLVSDF